MPHTSLWGKPVYVIGWSKHVYLLVVVIHTDALILQALGRVWIIFNFQIYLDKNSASFCRNGIVFRDSMEALFYEKLPIFILISSSITGTYNNGI